MRSWDDLLDPFGKTIPDSRVTLSCKIRLRLSSISCFLGFFSGSAHRRQRTRGTRCLPTAPERRIKPTALAAVIVGAHCEVGVECRLNLTSVSRESLALAAEMVVDRLRRHQPRLQGPGDTLRRQRVERGGRVAHGDPVVARRDRCTRAGRGDDPRAGSEVARPDASPRVYGLAGVEPARIRLAPAGRPATGRRRS